MKATVVFPIKGEQVLLAKKTKKVGVGLWNGYGGKAEVGDVSIRHTAARELIEESGGIIAVAEDMIPKGLMDFYFFDNTTTEPNFSVAMYVVTKFSGDATTTDEMDNPTWFPLSDLPYGEMLPADRDFVPKVLNTTGIFHGKVWFDEGMKNVLKSEYKDATAEELGI